MKEPNTKFLNEMGFDKLEDELVEVFEDLSDLDIAKPLMALVEVIFE